MPNYRVITPCGASDVTITFPSTSGTLALTGAGLTGFIPSQNTSAPNATVNVSRLLVDAASTNADIALQPKGTGAFLAQLPDSTSTGGNKRGARAVDLQLQRNSSLHVASGNNSVIVGGLSNTSSSTASTVVGGDNNTASAAYSFVGGGQNNVSAGTYNAIVGGVSNQAGIGSYSFIGCGQQNTISSSSYSVISGGFNNFIESSKNYSVIIGGQGARVRDSGVSCFANYYFGFTGDSQYTDAVFQGRTFNATPLAIGLLGVTGPGSGLTIPLNSTVGFRIMVVCRQTGTSNIGAWEISGVVENTASTLTAYNVNVNLIHRSVGSWSTTVVANSTSDTLDVQVTGSSDNVQWTASGRFTITQFA